MKHLLAACVLLAGVSVCSGGVYYVDDDAPLGGGGKTWDTAFRYLQDALATARPGDEIHVAQGLYKPDHDELGHVTPLNKEETFRLVSGVVLYGGYAGIGAPDPDERDFTLYESILCGDLLGNDGPGFSNNEDNSYHVVTTSGTDITTRLDGFIIERGNAYAERGFSARGGASSAGPRLTRRGEIAIARHSPYGGGVRNEGGNLTIANCPFRINWGWHAGALYSTGAPVLYNCSFIDNDGRHAGGICSWGGHVTLTQCVFTGNDSEYGGSALFVTNGIALLRECTLEENTTPFMGAVVYLESGTVAELERCRLRSGHWNPPYGTAVYADRATVTLNGSLLWDFGVATRSFGQCTFTLTGCTFADNNRTLMCEDMSPPGIVRFSNCVLWNHAGEEIVNFNGSTITGTYSDVHGGWPGMGNINADPIFADPSSADYRLQAGSPCIDAGDNDEVPALVIVDLDGNRRFVDDPATPDSGHGAPPIVDMGAYEYQVLVTPGDLNCDGNVDFGDINPFILALIDPTSWQAAYTSCGIANADINADGRVDFGDINPFVALLTAP